MANRLTTFEDFLINQPAQIDLTSFVISLIIAALLGFILGKLYIRYGTALSNRRKFAANFVLLTTTTTLVITIVKSSLALSLGLVGALSIVRFRAAIKEPEELLFLFFAIAVGLGLGAGQLGITLVAFVIVSLLIFGRRLYHGRQENQNLYLTVSGRISRNLSLEKIVEVLKRHSTAVHLKRFDKTGEDFLEASFVLDLKSFEKLERIKSDLNRLSKYLSISYLDEKGIY